MKSRSTQTPWEEFHGPNLGYLYEQYERYLSDKNLVDESFRGLFDQWGSPHLTSAEAGSPGLSPNEWMKRVSKLLAVLGMAANIRKKGHLEADINPIERRKPVGIGDMKTYGVTEEDVRGVPAEFISPVLKETCTDGLSAISYLKELYMNKIGYEIEHIDDEERKWFERQIEQGYVDGAIRLIDKKRLLEQLAAAEGFERFIHKTYVGQKRFSVEGLETLVPAVEELVRLSAKGEIDHVAIAMAHRGRLNMLAHVLDKPYESIFSQFQHSAYPGNKPALSTTGDVKYHMGSVTEKNYDGKKITVTLGNNPSHLEIANSVVEGYARAAQEDRSKNGFPEQDFNKALCILVHGDAAFPGQGCVAETFNFSQTAAYHTGGTIHIIANNNIGFTAETSESRSTEYASDLAKGFDVPIIHVNADDPEACLAIMGLAFRYRQEFNRDIVIDLIGYRRLGHNEMDEPMATNPVMYKKVRNHPTITAVYQKQAEESGVLSAEEAANIEERVAANLQSAYDRISKEQEEIPFIEEMMKDDPANRLKEDTAVDRLTLSQLNAELLDWPEDFKAFKKVQKILERRREVFENKGKVDWGHAEALAFASILHDGMPIRITGEDTERGTFSHRNLVLSDERNGAKYCPLHEMESAKASFAIHNSVLSEEAVLGFEYGYSVFSKETLVFWEAQFGDFANGAQVLFDQFISSGEAKWGQKSGLVVLLPHGFEGQGPEHSSARLERFLQLCAESNMTVANLSTAAQYFHLLRRQAVMLQRDEARPLILMTPKSLLRNQAAACYIEEFTNGEFQPVIEQPGLGTIPEKVERIVFCTGRIAVELADHVNGQSPMEWLDIIRVEELYPFPQKDIMKLLNRYKNLKEVIWVQEEPKNMGAYRYMEPHLAKIIPFHLSVSYIGRPEMASPAEGDSLVHKKEQQRIINQVFSRKQAGSMVQ